MSFPQQRERLQSAPSQHLLLAASVFLLPDCCCHHLPCRPLSLNVRIPEKARRAIRRRVGAFLLGSKSGGNVSCVPAWSQRSPAKRKKNKCKDAADANRASPVFRRRQKRRVKSCCCECRSLHEQLRSTSMMLNTFCRTHSCLQLCAFFRKGRTETPLEKKHLLRWPFSRIASFPPTSSAKIRHGRTEIALKPEAGWGCWKMWQHFKDGSLSIFMFYPSSLLLAGPAPLLPKRSPLISQELTDSTVCKSCQ